MMDNPICPKCHSNEIDYGDCYDIEVMFNEEKGIDEVHRHIEGTCMKCGTSLQWQDVYVYKGVRNIVISD